ncbi:MAG: bifunctional N-acetylglucosamine-1-phosphate uridyltransferase/glucosamine-1-phosphate acetyltransferase [Planctomycetes bacterium]|nr:bifunctional N-acetylglucosamine-1-phosphate uridyltransferase/glucosamine-1-phosphate acetyltransferase [Planctomycetota bacterium]
MPSDLDIVILAAGRGSRMKSDIPKVLHPLLGEALIHHVLDAAESLDPRSIVLVVGHGRDQVKKAVAGRNVVLVTQREQKGTGHAVGCTRRLLAGRRGQVMVLSGDVPLIRGVTLQRFAEEHRAQRAQASVMTATLEHAGSLGRIQRDDRGHFQGIVEARDADFAQLAIREINAGMYVFRNAALFDGLKGLRLHQNSGEYYLPDVVKNLARVSPKKVHLVSIGDPNEALGINTGSELMAAQEILRRRIALEHAARGVELVDPASTFIAKGVTIGAGTVIWPFSVVMGSVSIGARCRIGPFAHLRPGAVLEDGAEVGNFVEVKNATLGAGSLARHLAYLGDASIGRGVNIGAGTITANFDGKSKHRTVIGDNAFIGSGSILIAPVEIGSSSTVGAGCVVPAGQDVPAGSVVVGVPARALATKKQKTASKTKRTKKTNRRKSSGA